MNDDGEGGATAPGMSELEIEQSLDEMPEAIGAAYDLLAKAESQWRPAFARVSLATELPVPPEAINEITDAIASLVKNSLPSAWRIYRDFPACYVLSLTGVAIDVYEGGAYWPGFFDRIGVAPSQPESKRWGNAFLAALDILKLPSFADRPMNVFCQLDVGHFGDKNPASRAWFPAS